MTPKNPIQTESVLWSSANLLKGIYLTGVACALYFGLKRDNDEIKYLLIEYQAKQNGIDNVQNLRLDNLERNVTDYPALPVPYASKEFVKPDETKIKSE